MTKEECKLQMKQYEKLIEKTGYHRGPTDIWIKIKHFEIKQVENKNNNYYVLCNCRNEQGPLPLKLNYLLKSYKF